MNLSHWLYLGTGLLLGAVVRGLFARPANSTPQVSRATQGEPQEIVQLQQKLKYTELAYTMAQEMGRFQAGFLARTTHELRSPLNGLIGLHQLILSDLCENPEEEREFITQAHERALKLLHLMDEILNVAKTEYGNNKLDIQPKSLAETIEEVHKLTYMLAVDRNFKFQILPPDSQMYVLADPRWLRQVLLNLVDSTIAQMQEGVIRISTDIPAHSNFARIWLDVPSHALVTNEPVDLLDTVEESDSIDEQKPGLSASMKLILNQKLLAVMGGNLEIVSSPEFEEGKEVTRLQLSIPLAMSQVQSPESPS